MSVNLDLLGLKGWGTLGLGGPNLQSLPFNEATTILFFDTFVGCFAVV
jgi:hypothetical protein